MAQNVKQKSAIALNPSVALELSSLETLDIASCDQSMLIKLYNVSLVPCKSRCRGMKNPTCFCNLLPPDNGFKKKGLWMKEKAVLKTLGPDPDGKHRQDLNIPAGLRNLGNTCYANTALQCLFSVSSFRRALYTIFSSDPPSKIGKHQARDEVASELGALFLDLEYGPSTSADTTSFAKSLQLDHSVQQDCQEFFKLLVTKIENVFGKEAEGPAKSLVQSLFCGKYSYVTTCMSCGRESESSSNASDYYELSLQVKGCPSLKDSLLSSLEKESLDGSNQYACEHCDKKTDATRQMVLRSLPPYVCFQLQRFVYDACKDDKLKVSNKSSFPLDLDIGSLLRDGGISSSSSSSSSNGQGEYELTGVILHKGTNAHHGHYVAHIRNEGTGKWWRLDDENAECMGAAPTGYSNDHGGGKAGPSTVDEEKEGGKGAKKGKGDKSPAEKKGKKQGGEAKGKKRRKEQEETKEDIEYIPDETEDPADALIEAESDEDSLVVKSEPQGVVAESAAPPGTMVSSSNAYMLLYRRKGWEGGSLGVSLELPEKARVFVAESNQKWADEKAEYQRRRQETLEMIERRKGEVRDVLSIAPNSPDHWISTSWFESWATSEELPTSILNQPMSCPHGKLDPTKIKDMKLISSLAWAQLQGTYGGGPAFKSSDFCPTCIRQALDETAGIKEIVEVREELKRLMASSNGDGLPPGFDPHAAAAAAAASLGVNGHSKGASSSKAPMKPKESMVEVKAIKQGRGRPSKKGKVEELAEMKDEVVEIQSDDEEVQEIERPIGPSLFWVSKTWLSSWLRKAGLNLTSSPTASITCQHNQLRPERPGVAESKRFCIPRHAWLLLQRSWEKRGHDLSHKEKEEKQEGAGQEKAKEEEEVMIVDACAEEDQDVAIIDPPPLANGSKLMDSPTISVIDLAGGLPDLKDDLRGPIREFPVGVALECPICVASIHATVGDAEERRRDLLGEKQALQCLMDSKETVSSLEVGLPYYLIPRSWLVAWQRYIQQSTSKKAADVSSVQHPRPPPLPMAQSELFCPCHGNFLRVMPPKVSFRRNRCVLDPDESIGSEVDVISQQDWESLKAFYGLPDGVDPTTANIQPEAVEGIMVLLNLNLNGGEDGGGGSGGGGGKRRRGSMNDEKGEGKGSLGGSVKPRSTRRSKGNEEGEEDEGRVKGSRRKGSGSGPGSGLLVDPVVDLVPRRETRTRSAANAANAFPPPLAAGAFPRGDPMMGGGFAPLPPPLAPSGTIEAMAEGLFGDVASISMDLPSLMMGWEGNGTTELLPSSSGPYLETRLGFCISHSLKTVQESKAALLTYADLDLNVEVIERSALDDFLLSCDKTMTQAGGGGDRGERRSRRRKGRGLIKVCSWTSLSDVKLLIYQALEIHPGNQEIYSTRGKRIAGDEMTLSNLEVYPDDELRVVDAQLVDGEDFSFLQGTGVKPQRGRREAETGFMGTALVSSLLPSPPTPAAVAAMGSGGHGLGEVRDDDIEIQEPQVSVEI